MTGMRVWGRRICGAALAALAAVPIGVQGVAGAGSIRSVQLHSSYENAERSVSRDIGVSVALPDGHELWIFGDTGVWEVDASNTWHQDKFIPGSTALLAKTARGSVPHGGELPSGQPAKFVPDPHNVYMPDGSGKACVYPDAAFAARWPTGAAVMATNTSQVLVTYGEVCVTHPSGGGVATRAEGWGYMLYNWRHKRIDRGPVDVFKPKVNGSELPSSQLYGWPMFDHGHLTMFSYRCTAYYVRCSAGQVGAVTMPGTVAALNNPSSYKLKQLATDGSSLWQPLAISVGRFPAGMRLIETTSITGAYKIFSAASAAGPWHLLRSGTLPGCPSQKSFCFALEGHPELSTSTSMLVSYHDPDSGPGGHIVVSAIPY